MKIDRVLRHLKALIAFDTQNPPRTISGESLLFEYLTTALGSDFKVSIADNGKGRVSYFAVRGEPDILFNAHLDTVPAIEGSLYPPFEMHLVDDRVYGRGACDIKGAAACLLSVAQTTTMPLALLFTTDEEGGEGCCVERFIESGACEPFSFVVVSEPTECRIETVHRGYLSVKGQFTGVSGHSSERRGLSQNAIHRLARWSAAAIERAGQESDEGLRSCFNIGTVSGGVKSNIIADRAHIHWSARLLPGQSTDDYLSRMLKLDAADHARWEVPFAGPPLPTEDNDPLEPYDYPQLERFEIGSGLDFWTEASLFSRAGIPALVFGPGSIEQAHSVDEWVAVAQLEKALALFRRMAGQDA
ncbi:MAG: acetylornithine deacetylase [Xanthomonadales bacterium]|nr:acetylornithine deacetylase [Xanthomonadales bacterium]